MLQLSRWVTSEQQGSREKGPEQGRWCSGSLDRLTGPKSAQPVGKTLFPGVSRIFQEEINFWIGGLSETNEPLQASVGSPVANYWGYK